MSTYQGCTSDGKVAFNINMKQAQYYNPYNYKFTLNHEYILNIQDNIILSYKDNRFVELLNEIEEEYSMMENMKKEIGYDSLNLSPEKKKDVLHAFHNLKYGLFLTVYDLTILQELSEELLNFYNMEKWNDDDEQDTLDESGIDIHSLNRKNIDDIEPDILDDVINEMVDCYCNKCQELLSLEW